MSVPEHALRLDKWLWFTRFYKTRTAASAAVQGGHVRVNGERARASMRIRIDDEIKLVRQQLTYELRVIGIPLRRGSASDAQTCYEEAAMSLERRKHTIAELKKDRLQMPRTRGKPDKHTRRLLRDRKGQ